VTSIIQTRDGETAKARLYRTSQNSKMAWIESWRTALRPDFPAYKDTANRPIHQKTGDLGIGIMGPKSFR
jgi:hypothetical protein